MMVGEHIYFNQCGYHYKAYMADFILDFLNLTYNFAFS